MILQAHWKNTFPKRGLVFITLGDAPPPGLVKDHTFPVSFLNPSLSGIGLKISVRTDSIESTFVANNLQAGKWTEADKLDGLDGPDRMDGVDTAQAECLKGHKAYRVVP